MRTSRPITDFSCLTFDCFGTLVDWEGGIYTALASLTAALVDTHPLKTDRAGLLKAFVRQEGVAQNARPDALYTTILADAFVGLAGELGLPSPDAAAAARFGASVADWPAYPDTLDALQRLQHGDGHGFKLVILSNVDKASFSRTLEKQFPGVTFDAIYTAQDIGSYKPDLRNFEYLTSHCETDLGVSKDKIIHTAQSLFHDHVPAKQAGLVSAWIERGTGEGEVHSVMGGTLEELRDQVDFTWHFKSMGEMADAVGEARKK
ncbi:uncharacterized protein PgNI_08004 [Pyricularia grisea]|uniref:Uncharacterized protein n=1 Tax=Pyricularia grisea TaxID=148305 RepID=A0A6P8AVA8_PYRGI|nr:uncharacterized protein PgNI_08004 [Pyricularia grisea]TLD06158.1 hypothetical protein PgNI_08004 [Pyricularia grisea]